MRYAGTFLLIAALLLSACDLFGPTKAEVAPPGVPIAPVDESPPQPPRVEYVEWTRDAYDAALADGKVVYLEFYAPWCPICRAMDPSVHAAFGELDRDASTPRDIVGFKVDYDSNAELKRLYGVSSQHTHIIIGRDGVVALRSLEVWDQSQIREAILSVAKPPVGEA